MAEGTVAGWSSQTMKPPWPLCVKECIRAIHWVGSRLSKEWQIVKLFSILYFLSFVSIKVSNDSTKVENNLKFFLEFIVQPTTGVIGVYQPTGPVYST